MSEKSIVESKSNNQKETIQCIICLCSSDIVSEDIFYCSSHPQEVCLDCLVTFIAEKINTGSVGPGCLCCVTENCKRPITSAEVALILQKAPLKDNSQDTPICSTESLDDTPSKILPDVPGLLNKYERFVSRLDPSKFECPQPGCGQFKELQDAELSKRNITCSACQATSCRQCGRVWGAVHCRSGICQVADMKMQQWLRSRQTDARRCPKCRAVIEKNGGCMHIYCTNCTHNFMWCCKQPFTSHQARLCPWLTILKHRHPAYGPCTPIRALTKGSVCVLTGLGVLAGGTILVTLVLGGGILVVPCYLAYKKGNTWRTNQQSRRMMLQMRITREQLESMASMQDYQQDLESQIQNNLFPGTEVFDGLGKLDPGFFFSDESGEAEPLTIDMELHVDSDQTLSRDDLKNEVPTPIGPSAPKFKGPYAMNSSSTENPIFQRNSLNLKEHNTYDIVKAKSDPPTLCIPGGDEESDSSFSKSQSPDRKEKWLEEHLQIDKILKSLENESDSEESLTNLYASEDLFDMKCSSKNRKRWLSFQLCA